MTAPIDEARLRELAEAATPGPWLYRPHEHDDWGWVCLEDRGFICQAKDPSNRSRATENAHRAAKTDPWEANARFIAAARTAIPALLDALSAERERAEYRIAEAYQVIGAIADAGGLFNHPDVQRALTYFSEAEPEGEILPFSLAAHEAGGEKI